MKKKLSLIKSIKNTFDNKLLWLKIDGFLTMFLFLIFLICDIYLISFAVERAPWVEIYTHPLCRMLETGQQEFEMCNIYGCSTTGKDFISEMWHFNLFMTKYWIYGVALLSFFIGALLISLLNISYEIGKLEKKRR